MTVTLELESELEARLSAQASAQGTTLENYLKAMVDRIASQMDAPSEQGKPNASSEKFWPSITRFSAKIPDFPGESFNRDFIYQDHE